MNRLDIVWLDSTICLYVWRYHYVVRWYKPIDVPRYTSERSTLFSFSRFEQDSRNDLLHRACYGRLLSVAWAKSMLYFANVFYLFIFLWQPYVPALFNGGSRKFYTWWTLRVNKEVTSTLIFSWSSLNYRVGQKVNRNKTCPSLLVFKNNNEARGSQRFVGQSSRNVALSINQSIKHDNF